MKFFFLAILFLVVVLFAKAQDRQYSTTDRGAIKYYALANESLDNNLYDDAIEQLNKAISEDKKFIEAHALLADVYRQRRFYKEAQDEYRQVIALNPEFSRGVYFKVGDVEVRNGDYANAKE